MASNTISESALSSRCLVPRLKAYRIVFSSPDLQVFSRFCCEQRQSSASLNCFHMTECRANTIETQLWPELRSLPVDGAWQRAGKPHSVASHEPSKLGQSQCSFVLWLGDNCAARQTATQPHKHIHTNTQTQSDSLAHTHAHCVM